MNAQLSQENDIMYNTRMHKVVTHKEFILCTCITHNAAAYALHLHIRYVHDHYKHSGQSKVGPSHARTGGLA